MRRSILHATAVAMVALALTACSDDLVPTSLASGDRSDTPLLPGGGARPMAPGNPNAFVDIVAGESHACARRVSGAVYCWGLSAWGQTASQRPSSCFGDPCVDRPTQVLYGYPLAPLMAIQVDAGSVHTCAIDAARDAYCWGSGAIYGATGSYGNVTVTPQKVTGGLQYTSISAGSESTCGSTTTAIYCWGKIARNSASPRLVANVSPVYYLSVGNQHACIVDAASHGPDCWGSNSFGQLGVDPAVTPSALPFVQAGVNNQVSRLTTQADFTCVELIDGTAQCFGKNASGQLGNSQYNSGATWMPQLVGTGNVATGQLLHGISTSADHACGLDVNRNAWCWGAGSRGQLGNGATPSTESTPQPVSGGLQFRAIAAGGSHTCAIGIDNHIYCWGDNSFAQLGAGLIPQYSGVYLSNIPVMAIDP